MRVLESYTFTPGLRGIGTIVIPEVLKLEDISHIWNSTRNGATAAVSMQWRELQ